MSRTLGSRPARPGGCAPAGRPATLVFVLLLASALIAACGLRTPSGVRVDQRSVDTAADDPVIRKLPPGPVPGADPAAIVDGFLEAAAAGPDDSYAQAFLAPGAVWSERTAARIYQPESLRMATTPGGPIARVGVSARIVGTLTSGGAFGAAGSTLDVGYQLRRVDGEWRIAYAPPGLLLAPRDLARAYRLIRTYAYNADRSRLVPEPGYVVSDRAGLAGAALHALLTNWSGTVPLAPVPNGPEAYQRPAGAAAFTVTAGLTALGSVVVRDGEATVDLGREAFNVPQYQRPMLVAQIAATLGSVPGVFTVRVLVEERPYAGGPVPAAVPDGYGLTTSPQGLAVGSGTVGAPVTEPGELVAFTDAATYALQWTSSAAAGRDGTAQPVASPGGLRLPALAPGGSAVAVLQQTGGPALLLARLGEGGSSATELRRVPLPAAPGGYLRPQWLDDGRVLVATSGPSPRVLLVAVDGGDVQELAAPGLDGLGALSTLAVSRDGTRVVAVAGPATGSPARRAYLGRVQLPAAPDPAAPNGFEQGLPQLGGWTALPIDLTDVSALTWAGDLDLAVIGRAGRSQPQRALIVSLEHVSSPVELPPLPADVSQVGAEPAIAGAPGRSYVVSSGSLRWMLRSGAWLRLTPAADSTYG